MKQVLEKSIQIRIVKAATQSAKQMLKKTNKVSK
jgi:hypothetical protein